jgi:hypothetical protein
MSLQVFEVTEHEKGGADDYESVSSPRPSAFRRASTPLGGLRSRENAGGPAQWYLALARYVE